MLQGEFVAARFGHGWRGVGAGGLASDDAELGEVTAPEEGAGGGVLEWLG